MRVTPAASLCTGYVTPTITDFGTIRENTFANASVFPGASATLHVACNSGRGNLSETDTGSYQTNSSTLIDPHTTTAGGPGDSPTGDCDPGNSGPVNSGGD
jgi:hypothetical protein